MVETPDKLDQIIGLLGSFDKRLTVLEQTQAQPLVITPQGQVKREVPLGVVWMRCDNCNDRYEGMQPPFGSARLCELCRDGKRRERKCDQCGQVKWTQEDKEAFICPHCTACVMCGDKSSEEICLRCQRARPSLACHGCNKRAVSGSAYCRSCNPNLNMSAEHFGQVVIPPSHEPAYEGVHRVPSGAEYTGSAPMGTGVTGLRMG